MQSQRHILRAGYRPTVGPYLWSIGLIGLTTAVFWVLYHHFDETNVAMFYLVAVVFCVILVVWSGQMVRRRSNVELERRFTCN